MDAANVDVDSRHYAFAYELHPIDDVPLDFSARGPVPEFLAGLFLPRDKPGWFGHSSYPPRLLLMTEEGLAILPHPSAKESARCSGWSASASSSLDTIWPMNAPGRFINAMRRDPEQLERTQQDAWDQRNSDPTGVHAASEIRRAAKNGGPNARPCEKLKASRHNDPSDETKVVRPRSPSKPRRIVRR
jgi:hypothetical protein